MPNTNSNPEVVESQGTVTVDAENDDELTEVEVVAQSPPALAPVPTAVPADIVGQADAEELLLTNIYERVNPSVVNIIITVEDDNVNLPENLFPTQGQGSGFVFDTNGHIITNNHVVADADKVEVTFFDGTTVEAKVIGSDPDSDLAVVEVNVAAESLRPVAWGDSDHLKVGQRAIAIGNPFGLDGTLTTGIVSALGRSLPTETGAFRIPEIVQTDAAINPGNSGGPLVNIRGELIGINTAIFSRSGGYQGIGFAVPSNMARLVMNQLVQKGKVTRGWLGVTIQELTPELSQKFGLRNAKGALVGDVAKGSPAEKAGLKRGDIILEYNGKKITDVGTLRNMVAQSKVGSEVPLTISRGGKEYVMKVLIMELPKDVSEAAPGSGQEDSDLEGLSGITVMDLSREIARQLGLNKDERGVVIVRVESGSSAEEAGIRKGDVIQEVDRKRIEGLNDYTKAIAGVQSGDPVLLFVNRGGRKFYVTVRAD